MKDKWIKLCDKGIADIAMLTAVGTCAVCSSIMIAICVFYMVKGI